MAEEQGQESRGEAREPHVDPAEVQFALQQLRSQQSLVAGLGAGGLAAAVGAALWAAITVFTGYQIGWMAVGVGFLVGLAVRAAGKGIDPVFGVLGACLSLLGCAAGNLLAVCGLAAQQESMALLEVLSRLDADVVRQLMVATFSPMDLLFYGIALYEGYKLSFRQLAPDELSRLLPGR